MTTEICPDCGLELPVSSGAQHPYIGASAACWNLYSYLLAGEPPVAATAYGKLLNDAYCVQHHGLPEKAAAVQSVAIHLTTLYAVLKQGQRDTYWIRTRMLRGERRNRFTWLEPPKTNKVMTIQHIIEGQSSQERAERLDAYVTAVANNWLAVHEKTVVDWYERFVLAERI